MPIEHNQVAYFILWPYLNVKNEACINNKATVPMFSKAESTIEITQAEKTATLMFSKLIFGNAYKRSTNCLDWSSVWWHIILVVLNYLLVLSFCPSKLCIRYVHIYLFRAVVFANDILKHMPHFFSVFPFSIWLS